MREASRFVLTVDGGRFGALRDAARVGAAEAKALEARFRAAAAAPAPAPAPAAPAALAGDAAAAPFPPESRFLFI